jgi:hypothetical protein
MSIYFIQDISSSTDRHKLYILSCYPNELPDSIAFIQNYSIPVINVGKQLAQFIDDLDDYKYLNIDVYDYIKKMLDNSKSKVNGSGNYIVAIYNFGILLEPALELNAAQLLKDFSKSTALIILWENQIEQPDILNWPTQKNNFFIDFSDTQLKKLQNAI